ncbi:metallo-beta-lactamase domain protein [Phyllosticta citriasiana]|uniref:Metallo-beta-lactamase domain protein n=1 Tax=Phyllosticta citriasiana TaxID=595635 RepID=A0ABR1KY26_9PEZI
MATQLTALPEVERLSPRVIRILGGNPGKFTLQGTNTYLIGRGPHRLLVDTGEGKPAWQSALRSVLAAENASISDALLTHWHPDHVQGVPDLLALCPSARIHKHQPASSSQWCDIHDGQTFTTDGATLRAFHCPGHTADHMAFVLDDEDAMFTGDNVLGAGTAVFEDLAAYMASLAGMAERCGGRAYPGHGPVVEDGRARIADYMHHRMEREAQVVQVLGSGDGVDGRGWTPMQIVKVIYKDVPENLHDAAQRGVVQVLEKLQKEERVRVVGNGPMWALCGRRNL